MSDADVADDKNEKLKGIGGWLILVAIGIALTPFLLVADGYGYYTSLQSDPDLLALTTPGKDSYNSAFALLMKVELGANIFLLTLSLVLFYAFFSKKKILPKLYISFHVLNLIILIGETFILAAIFEQLSVGDLFDEETTKSVARGFITLFIWVPYMLISVRVKNTFIN